jgi:glucose/mannose-6-phosphate isomerase
MQERNILRHDTLNMRKLLIEFPQQIEGAIRIGKSAKVSLKPSRIRNIVVTGLGGSAIGGDLLRSFLADELAIPFAVNRHYFLPEYVDANSLVIVSSYSGNTEETIAAHEDARKRKAQVLCISSNGETERLAKKYKHALVKIPTGFPPRAALGYSFFPVLVLLARLKLAKLKEKQMKETVALLRSKVDEYTSLDPQINHALALARRLHNRIPIVYSPAEWYDSVNLRWRGQFSENAKVLAFGHVVPEMNHNELVGWKILRQQMKEMAVIFLRDRAIHHRVAVRMNIMKTIISEYAAEIIEVESEGNSLLARMFSLIYLGDWVSFYLAILNGVDPTPVKVIDYLKNELGKV